MKRLLFWNLATVLLLRTKTTQRSPLEPGRTVMNRWKLVLVLLLQALETEMTIKKRSAKILKKFLRQKTSTSESWSHQPQTAVTNAAPPMRYRYPRLPSMHAYALYTMMTANEWDIWTPQMFLAAAYFPPGKILFHPMKGLFHHMAKSG